MVLDSEISSWIAEATGASSVRRTESIQSLWSGYGELFRAHLAGGEIPTVIVKWVKPPAIGRRARADVSDARKRRSYEVESAFYRRHAASTSEACRVPRAIASQVRDGDRLLLLEDLDAAGFSERRRAARTSEIDACLAWLASFHATFLGVEPVGLWKVGTYWHLATRTDELAAIDDRALREAAPILDRRLSECRFSTFVHGDAKLANFCFAPRSASVAGVDFQYVGGGCGMKDVAYLLSADLTSDAAERVHLDAYFRRLRAALVERGAAVDVDALETEWRALHPIACADYYRFLAGWSKAWWRSDSRGQHVVRSVLRTL